MHFVNMHFSDLKKAQSSLWIHLPILCMLSFSTGLAGLTIYAKYKDCDPLLTDRICSPDQVNANNKIK